MPIESNGHTSLYNKVLKEKMAGFPEALKKKSGFGKGLEEARDYDAMYNRSMSTPFSKKDMLFTKPLTQSGLVCPNNSTVFRFTVDEQDNYIYEVVCRKTYKLYSIANEKIESNLINSIIDDTNAQLGEKFTFSGTRKQMFPIAISDGSSLRTSVVKNMKYYFKHEYELKMVDSLNEISDGDYIILFVDNIENAIDENGNRFNPGGFHGELERVMGIDVEYLKIKNNKNKAFLTHIILHEEGHNLGLSHYPTVKPHSVFNLMSYKSNPDGSRPNNLVPEQYDDIVMRIFGHHLYLFSTSIEKTKFWKGVTQKIYHGSAKQSILDRLSSVGYKIIHKPESEWK